MIAEHIRVRIEVARFCMIAGIVLLHVPPFRALPDVGNDPFELLKAFFSYGIFRATVPLLTVISGFLLFSSRLDHRIPALVKTKARTLLIPLLAWNIPMAISVYLLQKYGASSHAFSANLYPFNLRTWMDATAGLFTAPLNYPTNFLRDLFVVSMLAPLMGLFLRRAPFLGLAIVFTVYFWNLENGLVLRNSMLVLFYVGGMAATQNWPLRALDRFAPMLLAVLIGSAIAIVAFRITNRELFSFVSPFLLWPSFSLIRHAGIQKFILRYSKFSFGIFLSHAPILLVLWMLYGALAVDVPYPVFWITAPVLTVIIALVGTRTVSHLFPATASFLLGTRIGGKKTSGVLAGQEGDPVPTANPEHAFSERRTLLTGVDIPR